MVSCSVPNCSNKGLKSKYKIDGVSYHKFPREDLRRKRLWVKAIKREDNWIPTNFSLICSEHFEKKYFYVSEKGIRLLNNKAVPSLFLPQEDTVNKSTQTDFLRLSPVLSNFDETTASETDTPLTSTNSPHDINAPPSRSCPSPLRVVTSSSSFTEVCKTINISSDSDEDLKIQSDDTQRTRKLKYATRRYKNLYENNRQKVKRLTETTRRQQRTMQKLISELSSFQKKKLMAEKELIANNS